MDFSNDINEEIESLERDFDRLRQMVANCLVMQSNLRIRLNNFVMKSQKLEGWEKERVLADTKNHREIIEDMVKGRFYGVIEEAEEFINFDNILKQKQYNERRNYYIIFNVLLKNGEIATHRSITNHEARNNPEFVAKWIMFQYQLIDVTFENKLRKNIRRNEVEKILDCWTEDL